MSVQSEIARIKSCVSAAYDAVEEKGGAAPSAAQRTAANLAAAVGGIPAAASPNLLDNGYFLDPVNQRGENVYSNAGWNALYSIDRWYLSCAAWDVSAHKLTTTAAYGRIVQRLDGKALVGKTVTFSALVSSVEGGDLQLYFGPGDIGPVTMAAGSSGLISFTITMHDPGEKTNDVFIALNAAGASAVIDAVKLELGSQQTLARQDAGGNWVLNDPPPNRALELAKCQRYQPFVGYPSIEACPVGNGLCTTENRALIYMATPATISRAPAANISFTGTPVLRSGNGGIQYSMVESCTALMWSQNCITVSVIIKNGEPRLIPGQFAEMYIAYGALMPDCNL